MYQLTLWISSASSACSVLIKVRLLPKAGAFSTSCTSVHTATLIYCQLLFWFFLHIKNQIHVVVICLLQCPTFHLLNRTTTTKTTVKREEIEEMISALGEFFSVTSRGQCKAFKYRWQSLEIRQLHQRSMSSSYNAPSS